MWLMSKAPMQEMQVIVHFEQNANPARIAEVERALRPYLPALAIAHPGADKMLQVETHPDYWIALFRRPMLPDHVGPNYPPDVAAEITAILARLDPDQRR